MHAPTTPRTAGRACPERSEGTAHSQPADKNPLTYNLIKVCPECAGPILRGSSCMACAHCGWGRCQ